MPQFRNKICKYAPLSKQERDYLIKLYITQEMTGQEIADKLNVAARTVFARLRDHQISKRWRSWSKNAPKFCPTCGHRQ